MAKKEETMPAFTPGVPVPMDPRGISPDLAQEMAEFAGAGLSERPEDFLLPFLYVAQSGSPQLKKQREDKYIQGLEVGDIFNTATNQFWKGDDGIPILHAWFQKAEVEWVPRDGGGDGTGYIATHPTNTPLLKDVVVDDRGRRIIRQGKGGSSAGHQLVETAYHFVILADTCEPAVVAMASTGLQISRQWLTIMRNFKIPTASGPVTAPTFARVFKLKTAWRQNDQGDWFVFKPEDAGWAGAGYEAARASAKQFYLMARENGVPLGRPPVSDVDAKTDTLGDDVPI